MPLPPSQSELSFGNKPLYADHRCYTDDSYACINGEIYGHCESEFCSGGCVPIEECSCPRHENEKEMCSAERY